MTQNNYIKNTIFIRRYAHKTVQIISQTMLYQRLFQKTHQHHRNLFDGFPFHNALKSGQIPVGLCKTQ